MAILATNDSVIRSDAGADLTGLSPAELAVHVRELLGARGANWVTGPDTITAARYGAALILAAFGVRPTHGSDEWDGITEATPALADFLASGSV